MEDQVRWWLARGLQGPFRGIGRAAEACVLKLSLRMVRGRGMGLGISYRNQLCLDPRDPFCLQLFLLPRACNRELPVQLKALWQVPTSLLSPRPGTPGAP